MESTRSTPTGRLREPLRSNDPLPGIPEMSSIQPSVMRPRAPKIPERHHLSRLEVMNLQQIGEFGTRREDREQAAPIDLNHSSRNLSRMVEGATSLGGERRLVDYEDNRQPSPPRDPSWSQASQLLQAGCLLRNADAASAWQALPRSRNHLSTTQNPPLEEVEREDLPQQRDPARGQQNHEWTRRSERNHRRGGGGDDSDNDHGRGRRDERDRRGPNRNPFRGGGGRGPNRNDPPDGGGGGPPDPSDGDSEADDGQGHQPPRRGGDLEDFSAGLARAIATAIGQPQGPSPDIWEGFRNLRHMDEWHLDLPIPWNKAPRTTGKRIDILKQASMVFPDAGTNNFRGNEDGTFFSWRSQFLESVHRQPLSISDKIMHIFRACDREHPTLKIIFSTHSYDPQAYRNIILSLETEFGGAMRAYNHLSEQLFAGNPLEWNSYGSVQQLRARIDKFIEHLAVHGLDHTRANNTEMFGMVISNLLTKHQAIRYREDAIAAGYAAPNTLEALRDWLKEREGSLTWSNIHHKDALVFRKTVPKGRREAANRGNRTFHTLDVENDVDEEEWDAPEMAFPTREDKKFIRSGKDRRTLPVPSEYSRPQPPRKVEEETTAVAAANDSFESIADWEINEDIWDLEPDQIVPCLAITGAQLRVCELCKKDRHMLHLCPLYLKMSVTDRSVFVNKNKRCVNCLHPSHARAECRSRFRCETCKSKHHSTLHWDKVVRKDGNT